MKLFKITFIICCVFYVNCTLKKMTQKDIDEFVDGLQGLSDDQVEEKANTFFEEFGEDEYNKQNVPLEHRSDLDQKVKVALKQFLIKARDDAKIREDIRQQLRQSLIQQNRFTDKDEL